MRAERTDNSRKNGRGTVRCARRSSGLSAGSVLGLVFVLILALEALLSCGKDEGGPSADIGQMPAQREARQDYPLQVHFLDVGHGDSALVQCEGHNMLIDGGLRRCGHQLLHYLRRAGADHLDAVVCSHEHKDHVGGLITVVHSLTYDNVYAPDDCYEGNKDFNRFVGMVRSHGREVTVLQAGERFSLEERRSACWDLYWITEAASGGRIIIPWCCAWHTGISPFCLPEICMLRPSWTFWIRRQKWNLKC